MGEGVTRAVEFVERLGVDENDIRQTEERPVGIGVVDGIVGDILVLGGEGEALAPGSVDMKRLDPMFADVARYVVTKQEGSTSRLQRAFEIGYNRAGKLSDQLEAAGIVGPNKGPKGRDVLIQDLDQLDKLLEELGVK